MRPPEKIAEKLPGAGNREKFPRLVEYFSDETRPLEAQLRKTDYDLFADRERLVGFVKKHFPNAFEGEWNPAYPRACAVMNALFSHHAINRAVEGRHRKTILELVRRDENAKNQLDEENNARWLVKKMGKTAALAALAKLEGEVKRAKLFSTQLEKEQHAMPSDDRAAVTLIRDRLGNSISAVQSTAQIYRQKLAGK